MNPEKKLEYGLVAFIVFLIAIMCVLAWSSPAQAEHSDGVGGYPDVVELDRRCNIYGGVSLAIYNDLKRGGDVGARWVASDVFTPRMREIFVPVIAELQKNHTTMNESDARELGRLGCMKYFANWFIKEVKYEH